MFEKMTVGWKEKPANAHDRHIWSKYLVVLWTIESAIWTFVAILAHEWGHLIAAKALGGDGYVVFTQFYYTERPAANDWLVSLSGGMTAVLVLMIINVMWHLKEGTRWGLKRDLPIVMVMLGQLVYAPIEVFC